MKKPIIIAACVLLGILVLGVLQRPEPARLDPSVEAAVKHSVEPGQPIVINTPRLYTNTVEDIVGSHMPKATPEQFEAAQKYVDQLKHYTGTFRETFDEIKEQTKVANAAVDEYTRDRLLDGIKNRREFNIHHYTAVVKQLDEADRKFMRAKGFDDATITALQLTVWQTMPWEE